jgi:hypothetical protein
MKILTDEEIQRLLDDHLTVEPSYEAELYQKVFSELSAFPDGHADNLAQDVVLDIQNRIERRATIKTYLVIAVSLAITFFILIAASFFVDKLLTLKLLSVLNNFKWVVVFLITIIIISTASDKLIYIAKHK